MEELTTTTGLLWWSKVGRWQVLATAIVLGNFFITLYFTGDKEAFTVNFFIIFFIVLVAAFAASAAAFAAFAASVAAASVAAALAATDFVALAVFAGFVAAGFVADEAVRYGGLNKKVIWLSYMAEFLIVHITILIVM